jgi:acetylglutamate kinase
VAGAVATAFGARKLIMLTDVEGVLGRDGRLISELSAAEARALIADGTVGGGMIPKLETCLQALDDGVGAAHVLDGRLPHVLLLETFTEAGVGTKLTPG